MGGTISKGTLLYLKVGYILVPKVHLGRGGGRALPPTPLSRCGVLKGYELNRWPSILLQAGWDYVVAHDQPGGCRATHVLGLLLFYVLCRRVVYFMIFISRYMANSPYVYLPLKCMGGGGTTTSGRPGAAGDYTGYRVCTDYTAQCILSDLMNSWDSCTEVQ